MTTIKEGEDDDEEEDEEEKRDRIEKAN